MNAFTVIFGLLALLYAWGWWRLRQSGQPWSLWRVGLFCSSAFSMMIALSSPVMLWAHDDFRGHMAIHLVVGMIAPLGLVMSAPVSLALKNIVPRWGRRWVTFASLPPARLLGHPFTAMLLNVGSMYALYMSELYAHIQRSHVLINWLHWHFIVAGCLFAWSIAGPDPAPKRPSFELRFGVLFLSMTAHAILAKWMYRFHFPASVPLEQAQHGAELMFYGGVLPEAVLAFLLLRQWLNNNDRFLAIVMKRRMYK